MPVNYIAVVVATVASIVLGSVWYGPLFGKMFMEASGMNAWTPEKREAMKKKMVSMYVLQMVASFVMFYTLAGIIVGFGHTTLVGGMVSAFSVWLGFVVPVKLGDAIWGGNVKLFWLGIGNMLVTLLVAGGIIGFWK